MPINSDRTTIYCRDGTSETLPADQARYRAYLHPDEWSLTPPPPADWDREIPKYRVARDLLPASRARYRAEPPFTSMSDDCWQYGERPVVAGEIITTTHWPHPSFRPLNYSAEKVITFFNGAMKSRLSRSPWHDGCIRLDNGISNAPRIVDVRAPQVQPMNLRTV